MRLLYLTTLFVLLGSSSAFIPGLWQTASAFGALGSSVGSLLTSVVPAAFLFPLSLVAPLKLSVPMLIGLKGLLFLKFKFFLFTKPLLLTAIGFKVGTTKVIGFKTALAKKVFKTAAKVKVGLLELPFKFGAAKIGAITGGIAGAKVGLAKSKALAKNEFVHPFVIPATALLQPVKPMEPMYGAKKVAYTPAPPAYTPPPRQPAYTPAPPAYTPAPPAYTPAPPAYTPAPPAYTPAPPAYTPAPPAYAPAPEPAAYRRKREVPEATEEVTPSDYHQIFKFIQELDGDLCVARVFCELAVEPTLLESNQGSEVTRMILSLDDSDASAPWMVYRNAAVGGINSESRETCYRKYSQCNRSTEDLIRVAERRMEAEIEE